MADRECERFQPWLDRAADGETGLPEDAAALAHAAACPSCRQAVEQRRAVSRLLRREGERYAAPAALRTRLRTALPADAPRRRSWLARWWQPGAWAASATALAASLLLTLSTPTAQQRLVEDLVDAHVRSLMAEHLTDVASSDRHTVKPWFNGRLDATPPVPDLADQGFPLAGGRLDYVAGRPAAALVYRRRQHVINLFVWPDAAGDHPQAVEWHRNGYTVLDWREGGLSYAIVTDLNAAEAEEFQRLWLARSRG